MRTIQIRVKPNARSSSLAEGRDGVWLAQLKSAPRDGAANAELIGLVARYFGRPRAAVTIKSGASSRTKLLQISD